MELMTLNSRRWKLHRPSPGSSSVTSYTMCLELAVTRAVWYWMTSTLTSWITLYQLLVLMQVRVIYCVLGGLLINIAVACISHFALKLAFFATQRRTFVANLNEDKRNFRVQNWLTINNVYLFVKGYDSLVTWFLFNSLIITYIDQRYWCKIEKWTSAQLQICNIKLILFLHVCWAQWRESVIQLLGGANGWNVLR